MTRRRWLLLSAAVVLLLATLVLGFPALVRWRAAAAAERAGFAVEIDAVYPGWGRVWLDGVDVKSPRLSGFSGHLDSLEVRVGFAGVKALAVHGGSVKISATRQQLVDAFRSDGSSKQGGARSERTLSAEGLFIEWLPSPSESLVLWGSAVERTLSGSTAAFDRVELRHPSGSFTARAAKATFDDAMQLKSASTEEANADLDLERLVAALAARESDQGGAAPSPSASARPTEPALPTEPTLPSEPTAPVLGAARSWAGAAWLPSLDPKRGARLRARTRQLAGLVARRLPEGGAVELAGLTVHVASEGSGLTLGPATVRVAREPGAVDLSFSPAVAARAEHRLALTAHLPIEQGEARIGVSGGPVKLSALGIREGDLGLSRVNDAELEVKATLEVSDDGSLLDAKSQGRVAGLAVSRPALGKAPLGGLSFGWDLTGSIRTDGSLFNVESGELHVGAVHIETSGKLEQTAERAKVELRLQVPLGSCAEMLTSLPSQLVPFAKEIRLGGTFSWSTHLAFQSDKVADMDLSWKMQNDCRFETIPAWLSPDRFRGSFSREVPGLDGQVVSVQTGPGTEQWAPLADVSRFMEAAVLVSEDGRFWSHKGFDQRAIESSIRQNVQAGRFVRGASTISMQLAKNLYLTREKTLSRKVQEALLTMLLEQELRKDEILELYFNVIELGPGIYGVKQGAEYYFHSSPADLSVAQAFFLATMLPSPTAQHFDETGALKPHWRGYVNRLMKIAAERGRISETDLETGLAEDVRFGVPAEGAHEEGVTEGGESTTGDLVPF